MDQLELPEDQLIAEINLTPLVDVSLVLVIIFMVVAPFLSQVIKPINLPRAQNAGVGEQESIKVSLFSDGKAAVGGALIDPKSIEEEVRRQIAAGRKPWVIVRADADMPHGQVMQVVGELRRIGVERVSFGTTPKDNERR